MVTYEYQYDYTELDEEENEGDYEDYAGRAAKDNSKAAKKPPKRQENTYL